MIDRALLFVKMIPLIPVLGFFLSYIYESAYFSALKIQLSSIFEIGDFVRSSIFFIIPACVGVVIAFFIIASGKALQSSKPRLVLGKRKTSIFIWILLLLAWVITIAFILAGLFSELVIYTSVLVGFHLIALMSSWLSKNYNLGNIYFYILYFALSAVLTIAASGAQMAIRDRGKIDTLPVVIFDEEPELFLLRNLSGGMLVINTSNQISFIGKNGSSLIIFRDTEYTFDGILCSWLGYCDLT